ncbi:hypothetical protein T265_10919 [Opisthorchis viverrini]|uniref:Integrase catalytic domain-containing protein n=1 Tax=Opisthorchis viverrini TaxID=6198 RepID=A0A074Z0R3_OPIVI|nr:hypothetical protein T265_10919 [Opisthorchis viverrini]KER20548.1 hypothetical protein T265_10919 [Opisthorchis viverrini]
MLALVYSTTSNNTGEAFHVAWCNNSKLNACPRVLSPPLPALLARQALPCSDRPSLTTMVTEFPRPRRSSRTLAILESRVWLLLHLSPGRQTPPPVEALYKQFKRVVCNSMFLEPRKAIRPTDRAVTTILANCLEKTFKLVHRVVVDVIGPLPETRKGNRFIVVMVDYLNEWCEAVLVKQQDTRPIFESHLLREICALLGIHKTRTTPYHSEGKGLVERTNKIIKKILTTLVDRYEEERWDEHIPLCMLPYRVAVHVSTGYAPTPVAPANLVGSNEYVRSLRERPFAALLIARENIGRAQQHQKAVYDRRLNGPVYEVGDHVFLHRPKSPPGALPKFHQPSQGPYVIIMKRPSVTHLSRILMRNAYITTIQKNIPPTS